MRLTARDRKLLAIMVPALILFAYWFLLLGPKREESAKLGAELVRIEQRQSNLGTAVVDPSSEERAGIAVRKLAVALPSDPGVSDLLVRLNELAGTTGVELERVTGATAGMGPQTTGAPARDVVASDARPTPQSTGKAGTAVAQALTGTPGDGATFDTGGLEPVALELSLVGSFSDIAMMLDRISNAVTVRDGRLRIKGRLVAVDSVALAENETGGDITATVGISAYYIPEGLSEQIEPDVMASPPSTLAASESDPPSSSKDDTGADSDSDGNGGSAAEPPPLPRQARPVASSRPPTWVPPAPQPSGGTPATGAAPGSAPPTGSAAGSSSDSNAGEEGR